MLKEKVSDFDSLVDKYEYEYLKNVDWYSKENANVNTSAIALSEYVYTKIVIDEILSKLPQIAVKLHKEGYIHIHKLKDRGYYLPYCAGFDTARILVKGLITPSIISRPAKHFDTAIDQLINFIMIACQERTGAIALNFVDLYLAPFAKFDNLDYKSIKQGIQRFIYNLNYTTRVGYQTPFSNIVLGFTLPNLNEIPVYVAGKVVGTADQYFDHVLQIVKAMCEVYLEGDAYGRPFTFPIPTVIVTERMYKIFNENPELYKLFIDVVRQRGQFYFLNSYKTDRTGLFSMCCRLTIDLNKVKKFLHEAKGIWSIPASTGSIGYVSINLPRLALLCLRYGYDEKRIFDMIMDLAYIARDVLLILRQRYQKLFKAGLYPLTREYVDKIDPFKYYFNTIAIVGIAEFVQILMQDEKLWTSEIDIDGRSKVNEIIRIEREILEFLNRLLTEFEKEDNILYNIEQAPAESASTKFALLDYREFPEYRKLIPRQTIPVKNVNSCSIEFREVPFYTSQNTPPYTTYRLSTQLYIEEQIQRLYTGGVIKHIFTHNPLPEESIIKIVEEIPKTYDLVYFTYSPTQSICLNCGYRDVKLFEQCPKCGSTNVENWSRIVGYYRPVQNWNIGKIAEFYSRKLTDF